MGRAACGEDTRALGGGATGMTALALVPLDPAERAHAARLAARIGAELDAAGGWLPFTRYMELALYAPGLGYYAAGAHKLGAGGDFVTPPQPSPGFGRAPARQGPEGLAVARAGGGFAWAPAPADAALAAEVAALVAARGAPFEPGYVSELCPSLGAWLAAVTQPLARGVALFLDYGTARSSYYAAERSAGTFACYHRQRRHDDPFVNLGLQDLTAWVDFTRVAAAGLAAGPQAARPTPPAHLPL